MCLKKLPSPKELINLQKNFKINNRISVVTIFLEILTKCLRCNKYINNVEWFFEKRL